MNEEVYEYIKYLLDIVNIDKPNMPKFDTQAYTDNEYALEIEELNGEFDIIDDLDLTIEHLQGD